jgi:hypothetical protein
MSYIEDPTYFVWKGPTLSDPYRVVYREVKTRTRKGTPITYELKSMLEEYESWEIAQRVADSMNADTIVEAILYSVAEE